MVRNIIFKTKLLLLLVSICLLSCNRDVVVKKVYYNSEKIIQEYHDKFLFKNSYYTKSNKLREEYFHGTNGVSSYVKYFPNGGIEESGAFLKYDTLYYYDALYFDTIVKVFPHYNFIIFFENGNIKEIGGYNKIENIDKHEYFNEHGDLIKLVIYKNCKLQTDSIIKN